MWFRKKEKIKRPLFRRIINYFIYSGVGVIVLMLAVFGFTQTSSFRNWLNETITEQVNSSTGGTLSIERIDGTIFTSLIMNNTLYELESDTLFFAEKIEVKTSPLKILFKIVYFRKVEIENANIAFLKDENGELNISRIVPPSDEPEDTTESAFSWKIQVADLQLNNVDFKLQSYKYKNSSGFYDHPNMDDFRLKDLNLELSAFADIGGSEYELYLRYCNVKTNLNGFTLYKLAGNFVYFDDKAGATDINLITARSNISLSAAISDFPVFRNEELELSKAPLRIDLAATDFHFDDLSTFISGTNLLNGPVTTHLSASGTLDDLKIEKLKAEIGETNFELEGSIQRILAGADMYINTRFSNFSVNQDDITSLLPSIGIPTYKDYGRLKFDSLFFRGKPLAFNAGFGLTTEKGFVSSLLAMDLRGEDIFYDGKISTKNLNLFPVIGMQTKLNSLGSFKGIGFSPSTLTTNFKFSATSSSIGKDFFDIVKIETTGENGIINSSINFNSSESSGALVTNFNFTMEETTSYEFDIQLTGFDVRDFAGESDFGTNLNIKLNGDGDNFDPDNLNLFAVIQLDSSDINGLSIDSTKIIVDIRSGENDRVLNIISDLADVTITGKFTVSELVEAVGMEVKLLASAIERKIDAIQPPKFFDDSFVSTNLLLDENEFQNVIANKEFNIDYLLEFKDFELLSLLLGDSEIDVDGELAGKFSIEEDLVSLDLETKINQLKFWDGTNLYYLSDFELNLDIDDKVMQTSFDDFSANVDLTARRIFLGSEIRDLAVQLNMNRGFADLNLQLLYQDFLDFNTKGTIDLTGSKVSVSLDELVTKYNQFDLRNRENVIFSYSNDEFQINSFKLGHNGGVVDLMGNYSLSDYGEINLSVKNIDGKDLSVNLFDLPPDQTPDSEISLNLDYKGTPDNPLIAIDFALDSVTAEKVFLGFVKSNLDYKNKLLTADINFFKSKSEINNPWLGLNGNLPIDLSLGSEKLLPDDEEFYINFFANNFDLRFAGSIVPGITKINGILESDIQLTGTYNDISSEGELQIKYGSFTVEANNLNYLMETGLVLTDNEITIASFSLENNKETKGGGKITASGRIVMDSFEPAEIDITASGDLKLLSEKSRAVNPNLYGDIAIRTREDMSFTLNETQNSLMADLILKEGANVTFSPTQSAYTNESDKFRYSFISLEEDFIDKEIDSLITISESQRDEMDAASKIPFDLDIKIQVENEAKMVFVLSREFKQNLTAYLGGDFEYTVIDNVPKARGELQLLDGSKLDFIKTFQARGSVKFLDEIDNPYLDVTSTYQGYYNPDTLTTVGNEYEVQVKISLEGPVKSLNTNFIRDDRNVAVYKRRTNFGQFELDASKTASDAIFFIIVGKFQEDASLQETNVAVSTAASVAGSIVGGFLNEQLGDLVRSVNVQQVGTETKFNLIGKVGEIRYEIGGTSQVFQDLSRANIKIEYPFIFTRLILRLERREPTFQSTTYGEMINELGLKYGFTF
ncbi:MAG: hypothetical protein KJO59_00390 [Ignavibacteria bacterium]|nr:hypothetical protein [Ignavibacteria bacterium]